MALLFIFGHDKKHGHSPRKYRKEREEKSLIIIRKRVAGLSDTALAKFVARASRLVKLRGAINVLLTGNAELRTLNRRFRGKDKPTDVLSFVPDPFVPASGSVNSFAGDIAISAEIARQNARRLGHSAAQEIKILALHGMLHLAGYDHESDDGAMSRKEAVLRRRLRLPAGLTERNGETGRSRRVRSGIRRRKVAGVASGGPVRTR